MNELAAPQCPVSVANVLLPSTKVSQQHLDKLALVYVRQSSHKQVEQNIESTQLKYRLADRAEAYGWPQSRVDIIDDELGVSGKSIEGRSGFQRLLTEVSLGHVGMVMGIEMSRFMGWVGGTHTMRYHAHYHTSGLGHVYPARYKSFPIQDDDHFFVVCRYVERNALRA